MLVNISRAQNSSPHAKKNSTVNRDNFMGPCHLVGSCSQSAGSHHTRFIVCCLEIRNNFIFEFSILSEVPRIKEACL